jgi:proteic killer suppression protein
MEVRFADKMLDRMESDPDETGGFSAPIVKAFRKCMQAIRAAPDERVFYAMKSLHFEKLKGRRQHQQSMRLNDQQRLILQLEGKAAQKVVVIVAIESHYE